MSDDRSDQPEKEDENSEELERAEGVPNDQPHKKPASDEDKESAPADKDKESAPTDKDKESAPADEEHSPESTGGEKEKKEQFDDFIDEDYDADVSDDYDYDEMYDYGLSGRDEPKKPRSAAGRFLSRQRKDDDDHDHEDDEENDSEEGGMSFLEHLEEFRWTVARSAIAFIVGVAIVVFFHQDIAQLIQYPLNKAYGSAEVAAKNLITYKAMGVITVFFQIALLGGLTLSMPFVLYFMGSFVAPGLTEKERRVLRPSCYAAFLLFLMGVAFAFFIILPLALRFTVRLNQHLGFDIFWAASDYFNMVVWFSLAIGFFFQFPLIVVLLVFLGVISTETLKRVRRIVFVGLMVFAALVSPGGDPISLAVTTGFMYLLYELSIWTGMRIERKKREEAEADEID